MATSIDLSIDELLLLQENQYHMSNFVFANIKPIGAERKISQSSNQIKSEQRMSKHTEAENHDYLSSFETSSMSTSDNNFYLSSIDELLIPSVSKETNLLPSHSFSNYPRIRSSYQPQSISTRIQTGSNSFVDRIGKPISSYCATQTYPINRPVLNLYHQTRSTPPMFTTPRERFQVNSIGRPILRTNNYNHFKLRR